MLCSVGRAVHAWRQQGQAWVQPLAGVGSFIYMDGSADDLCSPDQASKLLLPGLVAYITGLVCRGRAGIFSRLFVTCAIADIVSSGLRSHALAT